jgi:hypothetical protein
VRRSAATGCEGKATDGDQAGAARAVRSIRLGLAGERTPLGRQALEPIRARSGPEPHHLAPGGERGAVFVRLLDARPAVTGPAGGEGDRGRIDLGADADRQSGEHLSFPPARTPDRALGALEQLGAGGPVEREAVPRGHPGGHPASG